MSSKESAAIFRRAPMLGVMDEPMTDAQASYLQTLFERAQSLLRSEKP
jgi:hypothetical protein